MQLSGKTAIRVQLGRGLEIIRAKFLDTGEPCKSEEGRLVSIEANIGRATMQKGVGLAALLFAS